MFLIYIYKLHKIHKCPKHKLHNVKNLLIVTYYVRVSKNWDLHRVPNARLQGTWFSTSGSVDLGCQIQVGFTATMCTHTHTHVYIYICVCVFAIYILFIMNSHIIVWYYPIISDSDGINGIYWDIKNIMYDSWKFSMMTSSHNNCRL